MTTDSKKILTIATKQQTAITDVKKNLTKLADCIDNMPSVIDLTKSYGSSVIKVNPNGAGFNNTALTRAMDIERELLNFIDKYMAIIDSLEERNQEMIINKFLKHKSSYDLKLGDSEICGNSRYYKILNEAYLQIALLDEEIKYTMNDHLYFLKYENIQQSKAIQQLVVLLIRHNEIKFDEYLDYLIHALPEPLFKALDEYINNDYCSNTTYQYQLLRRAIFTLALNHTEIKYNINDFYNDLRLTGSGWKKYYNEVIQLTLFNEY